MLYSYHEINERDTSKLLEVLDGSLTVVVVVVCGGGEYAYVQTHSVEYLH